MSQIEKLISDLVEELESRFRHLPDGFHSTWDYTETGNAFSHPVTLGLITAALGRLCPDLLVSIDTRFNTDVKFQPDITLLDGELNPCLYIDYESPNSSDARIPSKDVDAYLAFSRSIRERIPYIIMTTLPNAQTPKWQLRYSGKGYYNDGFGKRLGAIRANPFEFWYAHYRQELAGRDMEGIHFLNISDREIQRCSVVQEPAAEA
ncbi:hypothetical protein [Holophaga foetida]|uniref:hypothetical protein n=1 Tax=Holophaga foetida TaxID=35839 RepID=UPI0002471C4E|nr:hypothetical protein [Holophaga foetida]